MNKNCELYRLRVSDYTCHDRLAPHGVLDVMQDIAGLHATTFNMSYEDLLSKNNNMLKLLSSLSAKKQVIIAHIIATVVITLFLIHNFIVCII